MDSNPRGLIMAKGFFTHSVCLLTDGSTTIDDIKEALEAKHVEIVKEAPPQKDWRFGGPTLVVVYLPEDNGYAAVDVVNQRWPDTMGDPKTDSKTFAAWSMGHFGPLTFPGNLARAAEHAWAWEGGRAMPGAHRGFIRIRLSYAFGAKDDDPVGRPTTIRSRSCCSGIRRCSPSSRRPASSAISIPTAKCSATAPPSAKSIFRARNKRRFRCHYG